MTTALFIILPKRNHTEISTYGNPKTINDDCLKASVGFQSLENVVPDKHAYERHYKRKNCGQKNLVSGQTSEVNGQNEILNNSGDKVNQEPKTITHDRPTMEYLAAGYVFLLFFARLSKTRNKKVVI